MQEVGKSFPCITLVLVSACLATLPLVADDSDRPAVRGREASPTLREEGFPLSEADPPIPAPLAVITPGAYSLSISDDFDLGGAIFKDGYPLLHTDQDPTFANTALGINALISTTPGVPEDVNGRHNSAIGTAALSNNGSGYRNTAVGAHALHGNVLGLFNTAVGAFALTDTIASGNTAVGDSTLTGNTSGIGNTAVGRSALKANTIGMFNTAVGAGAIANIVEGQANTALGECAMCNVAVGILNTAIGWGAFAGAIGASGSYNAAVGHDTLLALDSGSSNVAIGASAGSGLVTGSHNIFISNPGNETETGVIRIGNENHTSTFIEGISNVTLPGSGTTVFIDNNNQLGTATSSRRFKEEIRDMGSASARLADLRPVTFRYTEETVGNGSRTVEFGLIAEEVAEVYPDLVVYDGTGDPYSVRYHLLTPMLLNELQRLERKMAELEGELERLRGGS